MKKSGWILFIIAFSFINVDAQNVGIGDTAKRARLEIFGAAGDGKSAAVFGHDRGISIQRNYPAFGFNQYSDDPATYPNGRYLGNGFAALWIYQHDDPTLVKGLDLIMYPSGSADAGIASSQRVWHFSSNNRFDIMTTGNAIIDVGRGAGGAVDGTARFIGTNNSSYFNLGNDENTYIRGGKTGSTLILNDVDNGKVIFGNGSTRVALNTQYFPPAYTLEMRQASGGMEISNASFLANAWEWRVAPGSPANFNAYYSGNAKTYFSNTNGALILVSDSRLKTNVTNLPLIMQKIMGLKPITYEMKDQNPGHVRSLGFTAQNVQRLFPQLLSPSMGDDQNLLGVEYSGFSVLAVKGVQEQQERLEILAEANKQADETMTRIEQKLLDLKNQSKSHRP